MTTKEVYSHASAKIFCNSPRHLLVVFVTAEWWRPCMMLDINLTQIRSYTCTENVGRREWFKANTLIRDVTEMIADWSSTSRAHVLDDVFVECRAPDDCHYQGETPQTQRRRQERSQSVISICSLCSKQHEQLRNNCGGLICRPLLTPR